MRHLPSKFTAVGLNLALKIPDLLQISNICIGSVDATTLAKLISWGNINPTIIERAVDLYINSENYYEANTIGTQLIPNARLIPPEAIERIITASEQNSQIRGSRERDNVLVALRDSNQIPIERFNDLLLQNGIKLK